MITARNIDLRTALLRTRNRFVLVAFSIASLTNSVVAGQTLEKSVPQATVNPQEFKVEKLGDGRGWDKTVLGFSVLKNNAGLTVAILQGTFSSPEAAEREVDDDLRYPPNILEQGQAKDGSGKIVGKRVVVAYEVPVTHKKYTAIVWNNGCKYHRVASQSSAVAHIFEASIKADEERAAQSRAKE